MILGYGLPVLCIREVWKRMGAHTIELPILGVAYGIFNEGIGAHTLTQTIVKYIAFSLVILYNKNVDKKQLETKTYEIIRCDTGV
jgi:hypothetical protein